MKFQNPSMQGSEVMQCINKRAKMALYLSPDYQINWPFGSEEVQNRFPR